MIQCDVFEIEATVTPDRQVEWQVFTDLPCGTRVIYGFARLYTNYSDRPCVWTLEGDSVLLERSARGDLNGASGCLNIDQGDAAALQKFNKKLGDHSAGIKTPLSDDVRLSFTVGLRQPLKAFGKRNENLDGAISQTLMQDVRAADIQI